MRAQNRPLKAYLPLGVQMNKFKQLMLTQFGQVRTQPEARDGNVSEACTMKKLCRPQPDLSPKFLCELSLGMLGLAHKARSACLTTTDGGLVARHMPFSADVSVRVSLGRNPKRHHIGLVGCAFSSCARQNMILLSLGRINPA